MWDARTRAEDRNQYRREHRPEQKGCWQVYSCENQGEQGREDDQDWPLQIAREGAEQPAHQHPVGMIVPSATWWRSTSFCNFPVGPCGRSFAKAIASGSHHFGT